MPPKRNRDKGVRKQILVMQGDRKTCQEVLRICIIHSNCYPLAPQMNLKSNKPILCNAHGTEIRFLRLEVGFQDCCRISTAKRMEDLEASET